MSDVWINEKYEVKVLMFEVVWLMLVFLGVLVGVYWSMIYLVFFGVVVLGWFVLLIGFMIYVYYILVYESVYGNIVWDWNWVWVYMVIGWYGLLMLFVIWLLL